MLAPIDTLLERYGIIARDIVLAEVSPGGFSGMYPALSSLEDIGRVRRGYFIDGFGGAQFGLPGAIDRLRSAAESDLIVMAATDPANPFGSIIPWPEVDGRPTRTAGARVAAKAGSLLAWMDSSGRRVCVFSDDIGRTADAVKELARVHGRVSLSYIGSTPIHDHELANALLDLSFKSGYKGFTLAAPGHTSRRSP
jgi:ATP-dependent Lhr-like helicase